MTLARNAKGIFDRSKLVAIFCITSQLRFNLRFVNNVAIATGGALIRPVDINYTDLEADVAVTRNILPTISVWFLVNQTFLPILAFLSLYLGASTTTVQL